MYEKPYHNFHHAFTEPIKRFSKMRRALVDSLAMRSKALKNSPLRNRWTRAVFVKCTSHSPGHPGPPPVMASLKAEKLRPKYSDPFGQVTSRYLSQNSPSLVTALQSIINFCIRSTYARVFAVTPIVNGGVTKDRSWPLPANCPGMVPEVYFRSRRHRAWNGRPCSGIHQPCVYSIPDANQSVL